MKNETTITSKGTITISAPIRKRLGLRAGQKVRQFVNKKNQVVIDPGISEDEFAALQERILKKIPAHLKGLTVRELKDKMAEAWVASEFGKS